MVGNVVGKVVGGEGRVTMADDGDDGVAIMNYEWGASETMVLEEERGDEESCDGVEVEGYKTDEDRRDEAPREVDQHVDGNVDLDEGTRAFGRCALVAAVVPKTRHPHSH